MSVMFTVPEQHCVLIKRFNEFQRLEHSGLNFKLPFAESLHQVPDWGDRANKQGKFIELTEQQSDTAPRQCQTKDNVTVDANASVYWRITDPVSACFEVDSLPDMIEDLTLNALRSNIGRMELDEVLGSRERINQQIAEELKDASTGWGVTIRRVEIQELRVDEQTRRAMTQQMEAERRRRAQIAESEGEAQATVNVAEAKKTSSVKTAEGQAEALRKIAQAEANYLQRLKEEVGADQAARILLAEKYIQGFKTISQNDADKVFLPNSLSAFMGLDAGSEPGSTSRPGAH